jgi:hypothetical protein
MDVGQARDYLSNLSDQPAMKAIREHEETLEEISELLDEADSLMKHLDLMPDFETEDPYDRKWLEKLQRIISNLKSYGDAQFLQNVVKILE